jgi:hypothetical protein
VQPCVTQRVVLRRLSAIITGIRPAASTVNPRGAWQSAAIAAGSKKEF